MAAAAPEQKTKISAESENPKRPGVNSASGFIGMCATKIMNSANPRAMSKRASRVRGELVAKVPLASMAAEIPDMEKCNGPKSLERQAVSRTRNAK